MPTKKTESGIRSGRFKGVLATPLTILSGRQGSRYRIFNAGPNAFRIIAGISSPQEVKKNCSLDFWVTGSAVKVEPVTAGQEVVGVYEWLQADDSTRPGRFRFNKADAVTARLIIDLSGGSTQKAVYRIYNSGENGFKVQANSVDLATVAADQSVDIQLPLAPDAARQIKVVSADSPSNPIDGSLEFLGDAP